MHTHTCTHAQTHTHTHHTFPHSLGHTAWAHLECTLYAANVVLGHSGVGKSGEGADHAAVSALVDVAIACAAYHRGMCVCTFLWGWVGVGVLHLRQGYACFCVYARFCGCVGVLHLRQGYACFCVYARFCGCVGVLHLRQGYACFCVCARFYGVWVCCI